MRQKGMWIRVVNVAAIEIDLTGGHFFDPKTAMHMRTQVKGGGESCTEKGDGQGNLWVEGVGENA
jgi:hypothetical protein